MGITKIIIMENKDLKEKIEKLYNEIGNGLVDFEDSTDEVCQGASIALQVIHSKLSHILGKSKIYTVDELITELYK